METPTYTFSMNFSWTRFLKGKKRWGRGPETILGLKRLRIFLLVFHLQSRLAITLLDLCSHSSLKRFHPRSNSVQSYVHRSGEKR